MFVAVKVFVAQVMIYYIGAGKLFQEKIIFSEKSRKEFLKGIGSFIN